jgi:RHS repeat-associated protein
VKHSSDNSYDNVLRRVWKNEVLEESNRKRSGVERIQFRLQQCLSADRQANQIISITEPNRTRTFGYDNADRLTSATSTLPNQNENYSFDGVGNRTSSHLSSSYGYQQGAFNRLTATQTATYSFDANGNVTSKTEGTSKWYYSYDRENRLTNATKFGGMIPRAGESIVYQYDALGRRVVRQDKKTGRTEFTHDGMDVLQDRLQKGDTTTTTNYVNGLGIDDKLKVTTGSTSKYFLTDHPGSTVGMADSNGAVSDNDKVSYDSFGRETFNNGVTSQSYPTRYRYTGREADETTGLMYYRARFYDSQIGRFTSEDPIGFAGGDVNLYEYVGNNPLKFIDPFGLSVITIFDREKGEMKVIEIGGGESDALIEVNTFSGLFSGEGECRNKKNCDANKDQGPIPIGVYLIDNRHDTRFNDWRAKSYRLYRSENPNDPLSGPFNSDYTQVIDPFTGKTEYRGGFYLHPGLISHGCITFPSDVPRGVPEYPSSKEYNRLDSIFQSTPSYNYKGEQYSGTLIVF